MTPARPVVGSSSPADQLESTSQDAGEAPTTGNECAATSDARLLALVDALARLAADLFAEETL